MELNYSLKNKKPRRIGAKAIKSFHLQITGLLGI